MTDVVAVARAHLQRLYRHQLHLQQLHIARYDVSGLDALTAQCTLRWDGDVQAGDLLLPAQPAVRSMAHCTGRTVKVPDV